MGENIGTQIKKGVEAFGHGLITFFAGERGEKLAGTIDGLVDKIPTGDDSADDTKVPTPQEVEGKLVQGIGNPRVYHIEGGKKRWVPSEEIMRTRFGSQLVNGRWTNTIYMPLAGLGQFPDGPQLEASAAPIASPQKAAAAASVGLSAAPSSSPAGTGGAADSDIRAAHGLEPSKS